MRLKKFVAGLSIALLVVACSAGALFGWSRTGWKVLDVPTGSMVPAIRPNSLVVVRKIPVESLHIGDVITYISPFNARQTISHRIIKTYTIAGRVPAFVTKGDANKVADLPVTAGSVVGKVVWHAPHIGAWLIWAKTLPGLLVLLYIPAMLLMAEEVKRLADYWRVAIYRLYPIKQEVNKRLRRLATTGAASFAVLLTAAALAPSASALLQSSTVALVNNRLTVAATTTGGGGTTTTTNTNVCDVTNNNNVNVTNTSTQTATSGSASTSSNTNGGTATSGSATNNNSTSNTISITATVCPQPTQSTTINP